MVRCMAWLHNICNPLQHTVLVTGWRRCIGCRMFVGHSPQKSPEISGSFAERDLQLMAVYQALIPHIIPCQYIIHCSILITAVYDSLHFILTCSILFSVVNCSLIQYIIPKSTGWYMYICVCTHVSRTMMQRCTWSSAMGWLRLVGSIKL